MAGAQHKMAIDAAWALVCSAGAVDKPAAERALLAAQAAMRAFNHDVLVRMEALRREKKSARSKLPEVREQKNKQERGKRARHSELTAAAAAAVADQAFSVAPAAPRDPNEWNI